jgi:predicted Ser/Thr protein kinase
MALAAGSRLGPYEIQSALGAGGMGEVYRARDTRLNRLVAIKVLSQHLTDKPEAKQRFEREAKTIATLNHPHICTLYDVGQHDGTDYLVMELLEGETLARRLERGPIPPEEALTHAIEIADALDRAHREAVTHRDLKPGNVMLTKFGVKLLDFGLAKLKGPESNLTTLSALPTRADVTAEGTVLGTLQYMAPEQLEGKDVDVRTDIFAFGALVHEMFTGRKAFTGSSQASLIGAILKDEVPRISTFQKMTPPALDRVVRKCMAKEMENRWQTAKDLGDELRWIAERDVGAAVLHAGSVSKRSARSVWILAAGAVVVASVLAALYFRRAPDEAQEMRLQVTTPPTEDPVSLAISPDGQRLVFVASSQGTSQLWIRALDSVTLQPLPGSDGAVYPFWSPDSRSIGFFADGKLKRIDIAGGTALTLGSAPSPRGGTWGRDGTILFAPVIGALARVSSTGGESSAVTRLEPGVGSHRFPWFLPDGRHFLYFAQGRPEVAGVYVGSIDGSPPRRLVSADVGAVYASSGFLLFMRQGTLLAQRFDIETFALADDPFPLADQVVFDRLTFTGAVSSAGSGTIVYRTGSGVGVSRLVWFDRSGKEIGVVGAPDPMGPQAPELSRDGKRVALYRSVDGNTDVFLIEMGRDGYNRFTVDAAADNFPVWSPDGAWIAFASDRKGPYDLYRKPSNGTGTAELLLESARTKSPLDWSSDGRFVLIRDSGRSDYDLTALPLFGEGKPIAVATTSFDEREGQFSPDARWVAYQSNESGQYEIYVQPFPGPGVKERVSANGGAQVRWRRDGRELFYVALDRTLMAVPIRVPPSGGTIEPGTPVSLFPTRISGGAVPRGKHQYAVSPDGQRFLMLVAVEEPASPITVILNWKGTR